MYILKVRLKEIVFYRLFRFAVVGVMVEQLVQLSSLQCLRYIFPIKGAYFLSVELAVLSNFLWSNLRGLLPTVSLTIAEIPTKFIQFNLASAGSIAIQQTLAFIGERYYRYL
jgi:putative flippase GtrA